jgi:predicted Zn-dependent peptidase
MKMKLSVAAFALGFLIPGVALAQGPAGGPTAGGVDQSLKGVELKGKVPVNREVLKINLPKSQETTLKNGLRVVVIENHKVPTFTMQMVILSGGLADPSPQRGLASFTATMLTEGTTKRTSREISEQAERLGASISANTGLATLSTNINAGGLKDNFDQTLELFADVIRNPKFPAEEWDKYKARMLPQLQFQRSIPQFLMQERLYRAVYGEHPAALIAPPAETLKSITPAELTKFHDANYRPNNAVLLIAGDVGLKELLPKIEQAFGDWQKGEVESPSIPSVHAVDKPHIFLIDRPGSVQTSLALGNLSVERTSADYFPLLVMNQVFGAGPAARLFRNLREDKGYTYGAYSNFTASKYPGIVVASAQVRTEVTEGALKEFMYEINRIRDERLAADELENAKRALTGSFALSLEQPATLLQNAVAQTLYGLPASYWDTYPQRIAAITADDVQRVARKYLDPANLQIVAVGDGAKVRESLAKYGAVQSFTADGKPVVNE